MGKEIDEKFDRYEKIIDRGSKLLIKVGTAIVGVIIGLFVALEQLDYHLFDEEPNNESKSVAPILSDTSLAESTILLDTSFVENIIPEAPENTPYKREESFVHVVVDTDSLEVEDNYDMPDLNQIQQLEVLPNDSINLDTVKNDSI